MSETQLRPSHETVLRVEDLAVEFETPNGIVHAVDGFSFDVQRGKTLAIVGESGSGKSVSVTALMGLLPRRRGKVVRGTAMFRGQDLLSMDREDLRRLRGEDIAMIFQDPLTALNPVYRVGKQIVEQIRAHRDVSKAEAKERAVELLTLVGIPNPRERVDQFPHEYSGGMRQRAMIAMALSLDPDILIADEPTTALDVTVQAQILDLIQKLQGELGMGVIMITHDLGVVAKMADEILVVYAGRMIERGTPEQIFYKAQHPYTMGLLGSIPRLDRETEELVTIPGLPPNLMHVPPGCPFEPRCAFRFDRCVKERPQLVQVLDHLDACFLTPEEKRAHRMELLSR